MNMKTKQKPILTRRVKKMKTLKHLVPEAEVEVEAEADLEVAEKAVMSQLDLTMRVLWLRVLIIDYMFHGLQEQHAQEGPLVLQQKS